MTLRVLFINTWDIRGGAAIAMNRLRKGLLEKKGIEEVLLVGFHDQPVSPTLISRSGVRNFLERAINKALNLVGLQYQFFPFTGAMIRRVVREFHPDVISLHNSHGGYFQVTWLPTLSANVPVIWTLHDMWSFTGNSAHTFGDESWKQLSNPAHLTRIFPTIGLNAGGWLLRQKLRAYAPANLTMVTPSRWLHDLARQSPVFRAKRIEHIFNGVDLSVFAPRDKRKARTILGIPADEPVLLFSSETLKNNPWKGGKDLISVLGIVNAKSTSTVHVVIIGEGELKDLAALKLLVVHRTGFVRDPQRMASYYAASDVFLYPTRADNLPNVLVEAIACGTPCITFAVGGCSEIIRDGYNGFVIEQSDVGAMAEKTLMLLNDRAQQEEFSRHARMFAEENFSIEAMVERYHALFESILGKKPV